MVEPTTDQVYHYFSQMAHGNIADSADIRYAGKPLAGRRHTPLHYKMSYPSDAAIKPNVTNVSTPIAQDVQQARARMTNPLKLPGIIETTSQSRKHRKGKHHRKKKSSKKHKKGKKKKNKVSGLRGKIRKKKARTKVSAVKKHHKKK